MREFERERDRQRERHTEKERHTEREIERETDKERKRRRGIYLVMSEGVERNKNVTEIKVAYWISSNIAIAILNFSLLLPL